MNDILELYRFPWRGVWSVADTRKVFPTLNMQILGKYSNHQK